MSVYMEDRDKVFEWFRENEPTFKIRSTNYSQTFRAPKKSIVLCERAVGFSALGLIQRVRRDGLTFLSTVGEGSSSANSPIFAARSVDDVEDVPVFVYDKSSAYTRAASELGIISEDTFNRLMRVSKRVRLMSVGGLGTRAYVREFENGACIREYTHIQPTRPLWNMIRSRVSDEMQSYFLAYSTVFAFWVDAIYSFSALRMPGTYREHLARMKLKNTPSFLELWKDGNKYLQLPKGIHR